VRILRVAADSFLPIGPLCNAVKANRVRIVGRVPSADHLVVLLSRAGCHLCEDAAAILRRLAGELGFRYAEIDIDEDARLQDEYSDRVPVILIDGKEHGYWRVEEARLRRALAR
jgi:glutaredoxin